MQANDCSLLTVLSALRSTNTQQTMLSLTGSFVVCFACKIVTTVGNAVARLVQQCQPIDLSQSEISSEAKALLFRHCSFGGARKPLHVSQKLVSSDIQLIEIRIFVETTYSFNEKCV